MPKEEVEAEEKKEAAAEATVLGLGVEGGFKLDSQKYDVVKDYALAVRVCYKTWWRGGVLDRGKTTQMGTDIHIS